jgi:YhhN-like protein
MWTIIFFVLAAVALLTQTARARSVTYVVRGPVKAAPAFFLAGFSWYLNGPPLLTLAFLLCACGDILLDMAKAAFTWAFEAALFVFAAALICLSVAYLSKPLAGNPLLPLSLPNGVLTLFVSVLVLPKVKSSLRIPGVAYVALLLASNIIASTSLVPIFLGSTLWLLSDLAIAVSRHIPGTPANGLTNLGLYDLGLYFIALGFLNS